MDVRRWYDQTMTITRTITSALQLITLEKRGTSVYPNKYYEWMS